MAENSMGPERPNIDQARLGGEGQRRYGTPQTPVGTPDAPQPHHRDHKGRNISVTVAAGVAGAGAIIGGWLGLKSGGEGSQQNPDSTAPAGIVSTPTPGFSETSTPPASITVTPEVQTTTPTEAGVESKIAPEVQAAMDKYYKEIGSVHAYGNEYIAVAKELQQRVPEPANDKGFVQNAPTNEIAVDFQEFPNGDQMVKDAGQVGRYMAWSALKEEKPESQQALAVKPDDTEEQILQKAKKFDERVKSGEDFTFTRQGFQDSPTSRTQEITVNPAKPVVTVFSADNTGAIAITDKVSMSFTEIDGILFTELHGFNGGAGYKNAGELNKWHFNSEASGDFAHGYALLGDKRSSDLLKSIPNIPEVRLNYGSDDARSVIQPKLDVIAEILVKGFKDKTSASYTAWSGPLRLK